MPVNDAVVIGTVLGLVFGAVVYYLYTRILQTERKMGLMENILLDLKVTTEQSLLAASNSQQYRHDESDTSDNETSNEMRELTVSPVSRSPRSNSHRDSPVMTLEREEEKQEDNEVELEEKADDEEEPFVPASKMNANYEALTYKELIVDARKRKIIGYSHMSKAVLCEALRRQDNGEPRLKAKAETSEPSVANVVKSNEVASTPLEQLQEPESAMSAFADEGIATIEQSFVA